MSEGWVMTGYTKSGGGDVTFKPISVSEHAEDALWNRGQQFLLMTATLISPEQTALDLGLEDDEWEVVHIDSTFPPENRPVIVDPVARMTMKTKDEAWPLMVERIDEILDENPGVRVLVHTVSYALTEHIFYNSKSGRLLTYRNAGEREETLERFLATSDAVLLAPSFERGVDLPEEACEIIIIAKVPYPYLGDKQIAAKLYSKGGKTWYAVQTIRAIVQMCGRGMRSQDDWCDTYILDAQFKKLWRDHKRLFPKWFREAVAMSQTDPKYAHLIDAAEERRAGRQATREF
jgi:Rad3-related DNA helicase